MTAQAVHASRMSLLEAIKSEPSHNLIILAALNAGHVDTVSVLQADITVINDILHKARLQGIPHHLFMESGHAHNDIINGIDVVPTALCLGPYDKKAVRKLTRNLNKL